jgi:hypothetical protein
MQAENDGLRADVDAMRAQLGDMAKLQADAKRDAETRGEARVEEAKPRAAPEPVRAQPHQQHPQQRKA